MLDLSDTIVAIASRPGPAARGLVRISGDRAIAIALEPFEPDRPPIRSDRTAAHRGTFQLDGFSSRLPVTVVLWPGHRSYTGQPVAEIHAIGSPPILHQIVTDALARGARLASRGEFTLRAFVSGRIDLAQSEAVLSVIEATSPRQLDFALRQLAGGLSTPLRSVRDHLLDRLVEIEANLDFVDEADVSPIRRETLLDELDDASRQLHALLNQYADRDRSHARPRVVLVGPPNAGKSHLFNALIGHDQAIVSPVAGTTRDYLIAPCDCDGVLIDLIDTAGIEPGDTAISAQAQTGRSTQSDDADLILACSAIDSKDVSVQSSRSIAVATKSDLVPDRDVSSRLVTSAATGEGLDTLRTAIARRLRSLDLLSDGVVGLGSQCRESLARAVESVEKAREIALASAGEELIAVELRQAVDDLGKLVGEVVTEDILDRIFRRFCIGK